MNILIIGGNGFIGSHLVDSLINRNHKVRVFDISHEKYRNPNPTVDYRISNLNSIPDLYEAMLGIDMIFHLASASVPSTSNIDLINDVNNNLIPSLNILNLAVRQGIKKIIYFSSGGAVYGNTDDIPITENHQQNPISSYGIIKSTIEQYIKLFSKQYNIDYLIIRPSNPYGPRQGHYNAQGVISTFLKKASNHESFTIYGDGNATKDYIYIDDLIEICNGLIASNVKGTYNVGSGVGMSLNEIIFIIDKVTKYKNIIVKTDPKDYDVKSFILDMEKTKSKLQNPVNLTSLEEGIKLTWEWINTKDI